MSTLIISTAPKRTSKRWVPQEISWDELCQKLSAPVRTGETAAEYRAMSADQKAERKDQGGFVGGTIIGGARVKGACKDRWLVTLDMDEADQDCWENFVAVYGCSACIYSTHSSTPQKPRLRWVLPISRAVSPDEYGALSRVLAQWIGIEGMDVTTYQPERLMYWPSCPSDGAFVFHRQDGEPVNPDAVLRDYYHGQWQDTTLWPVSSREDTVVRRDIKKQGDPREKRGIVGAFCRAYDVDEAIAEFLPDKYAECAVPGRYTFTGGTSAAGAVVYEGGLFLYSHHEHDPAGGQLCNSFDLVRIHKFGELDENDKQDDCKRPSYKAMVEWASELDSVKKQIAEERMADFADMESADEDWTKRLTLRPKTAELEQTITNTELILLNDPALRDALATNELYGRKALVREVPWRAGEEVPEDGILWTDFDKACLLQYLEQRWGLRNAEAVRQAVTKVAGQHTFHPIRDYLEGLHWDGVERVDTMLVDWMGAEDSPYVRAVTRKWMCAAVARIMRPGIKFDNMLMLVGPQGIGKSAICQKLSLGYYNDSIQRVDAREAYEGLRGKWIIELAEMNAVKKAEIEAVKTYISKTEDTYRAAYKEEPDTYKRQCVFFGTTNEPESLRDKTGGRRFWVVGVRGINHGQLKGFDETVGQLWAEAVVKWRAGEVLWLNTPELIQAAAAIVDKYSEQDEMVGEIEEYLDTPLPDNWEEMDKRERRDFFQGASLLTPEACHLRRDQVSVVEIKNELTVSGDVGKANDVMSRRIAKIMNLMPGWVKLERKIRIKGYGAQYVYRRDTRIIGG